jgi:hypothetical protein
VIVKETTVKANDIENALAEFIHKVMSISWLSFRSEFEEIENKVDKLLIFNNQ